ncbi:MAG: ADP-ribosylglycohydrolase family protein [Bacteroidetes bacterium]|nr:MAG: ADP-ribosylglycohydrolase family protein [Bacteroidota bacterium]
MNTKVMTLLIAISIVVLVSCKNQSSEYKTISADVLKDKIAGGWAGKMMGVTFGAPTEFRAQGKIYTDSITWKPSDVKGSMWQDDIYVQLTFMMTMDKYGMDAPIKKFHEMFAKAGYPLWHANVQSRKNYYDSIFAPQSGQPEYNFHADDIDFQIESDYIGFMSPGMPQTAVKLGNKIGRIMNYGDGIYGGIFVAALYSQAFFSSDIPAIIENALKSIPAESDYYKIIKDVIKLHKHYPTGWKAAWIELEEKWDNVDICGAGSSFNIDAKFNGAFIVMGLLYGDGDPLKTMNITTKCGQDSDCNPSNAMALLGVINGFSKLPADLTNGVSKYKDSIFINTNYSFTKAVENTYNYALTNIQQNEGIVSGKNIKIKIQEPVAPALEVSFPNVVFDKKVTVFEEDPWKFKGKWQTTTHKSANGNENVNVSQLAEKKGDMVEFTFTGTGVSLNGTWNKVGGKADIFVDDKPDHAIDTYFNYNNQEYGNTSIWHKFNLTPATHKIRIEVKGEKRTESEGARIELTDALVFITAPKKNECSKFSFE